MISRLPLWVWFGGWVLTFIAGIVNAIGFLGFTHQAITHLTGTATLSAIALAQGQFVTLMHLGVLMLSFLAGAVLSGFLIQHSALKLGRRYGLVLGIESALLFVSIYFLRNGMLAGECLAAAACGLQNAMASSYSGAVVRTTHISGMVTDIGIIIGHWLRGLEYDARRMRLYLLLVFGFGCGGVVGAILFTIISYWALLLPAMLTGAAAGTYSAFNSGGRR